MNQNEILTKLSDLKGNLQHLFMKKNGVTKVEEEINEVDNFADDLPLTLNRDAGPGGVSYYSTENSVYARGARKEKAQGIDSFGTRN
jgi:hypothetical protein